MMFKNGANTIDFIYSNGALLILNWTSLNNDNALLALNWQYCDRYIVENELSRNTIKEKMAWVFILFLKVHWWGHEDFHSQIKNMIWI